MIPIKVEKIQHHSVKVFRMSTLDLQNKPVMWVSSFLIDGLLINFGHHHAKDASVKKLDFTEIEMCVLSNHHEDHIGACYDLIHKHKIPIYANKTTAFLIRMNIKIPSEQILVWGLPKPFKAIELPNTNHIKTNQAKFRIIPSPSHCNN